MRWLLQRILNLLFKTKVTGLDQMTFSGPTVILPNHLSFLDAVFLYAFLPKDVYYVVNTGIAQKLGILIKYFNHVNIDPLNPYSLKRIIALIKSGKTVVIFPEGRITTTGGFMKVYSGVGFVAHKTGAMIYPLAFTGLQYSKLSRIKAKIRSTWFPEVRLYVDKPISLKVSSQKTVRQQKQELGDQILSTLQQTMFKAKQTGCKTVNLFNELLHAGHLHGMKKTMIEDSSGRINYKKAIIGSYVLGEKLKTRLGEEQRVGVLLPNSIGHAVTLFSLFYSGYTPAILNFSAGVQNNLICGETAGITTVLTSRVFVAKGDFGEYVANLAEKFRIVYLEDIKKEVTALDKISAVVKYLYKRQADDSDCQELILFTSGSESSPKGVVLTHANIKANIDQMECVIDFTHQDKMLNPLPMFHSFGLTAGTFLPIMGGIEVFLYPSPLHYKIIPEIAYEKNITMLLGTPTFLMGYGKNANNYDFYRVRYVLAGGEKLKEEVRQLWQEKFGLRILEGYGTTEMSPVVSFNTPLFNRTGTVGKFLPGIQWKIEAVEGIAAGGNLWVQGPNLMAGYLLHGQGFKPVRDWYDCGDVVEVDQDGFISITARLKRFAKISGEMVSLDAVEKAAAAAFGGDKHAAVNMPDEKKGEKILLYTQQRDASKQGLREYLHQSGHSMLSMPAEIYILEALPLLGSGKIDYVTLKAIAGSEQQQTQNR